MERSLTTPATATLPHRLLVRPGKGLVRFARAKPLGAVGGLVMLGMLLMALLADAISPYDPLFMAFTDRLQAPSLRHPMGTDNFGRDILSNVIHGARISVYVSFISVALGTGLGLLWGLASGYIGGRVDLLSQRLVDILLALPPLVLAMALMSALGTSVVNTIIAISISFVPITARVVRASAISTKEMTYVEAARAIGAPPHRIALLHVFPHCVAPYLIVATTSLGTAILLEASLSFLGVGIPPPAPSWGRMLAGLGRLYITEAPWMSVFPGLAITVVVLGFNLLGDALRDVWDPRLRGSAPRPARGAAALARSVAAPGR